MMKKLTCDYCFEDHFFAEESERPESCKNCHSPLGHLKAIDPDEDEQSDTFEGIRLRYEKTGEVIAIPHSEIIILGRHNAGRDILEKIPQVSREHCKIEFLDGKYKVTDLNSLNGTYLGKSHHDCLKHQNQELKNNDLLYLGKEPFRIALKIPEGPDVKITPSSPGKEELNLRYKCKACGKIHDLNLAICDECGSYGQIEPLST